MKSFKKKIKKNNFYKEYLTIWNGLLNLSHREIDVLSMFMEFEEKWNPIRNEVKDLTSTHYRKVIMDETGINKNNLSKYIARLKKHRLLVMNEGGGFEVEKGLMPSLTGGIFEMVFVLDTNETNE